MTEKEIKAQLTQAHIEGYNRGYANAKKQLKKENAELKKQIEKMKEEHKQDELLLIISNSSARAELNEKIEQLEKENAELKEKVKVLECDNYNANCNLDIATDQLAQAKEIILKLYNAGRDVLMCRAEEKAYDNLSNAINDKSIEQFLKEIEK